MAEKQFNFTELLDRRGSNCHKWDGGPRVLGRQGLLPFWVADMDFPVAPVIQEALRERLDHRVFGYTFRPDSLDSALVSWFAVRHGWSIDPREILEISGIVPFLHILVQTLTGPDEPVIIQEPVYFPFRQALERNGRIVAENPLVCAENGRWTMNLDGLASVIEKSSAKLLILCNPHNPVGRAWERRELIGLAELCRDKGVCVVSDEIHADIVFPGFTHTPWLSLPEVSLPDSMALVSATNSFNIPGLNTAFAVIPDEKLRQRSADALSALGMGGGSSSPMAYTASQAAWEHGGAWLDALLLQLAENDGVLREYLADKLPAARPARLEATYLEWINLSALGLEDERMYNKLLDAGIWLSRGTQFGRGGEHHVRMNIACPRNRLEEGLDLISKALG